MSVATKRFRLIRKLSAIPWPFVNFLIFLKNYFLGIITGGIVFLISYNVFPVFNGISPSLVGSSAGVMSILIFVATYTPNQEVRVIFFNVKLQYIGIAIVVLDILQIPNGNAGGRLAHLGGALIGFIYANQLQKGNDFSIGFTKWINNISNLFKPKSKLKTVHKRKKTDTQIKWMVCS